MAADLVRRQVRVIATPGSTPAALAAKAATTTISIVFSVGTDPVKAGLVASLNRPGSNVTGMSYLISLLVVKQLEQLHELAPNAVMAVLLNPKLEAAASVLEDAQVAARALGLPIHVLHASTDPDLDTVFASLTRLQAGGLVISADAFFFSRLEHLVGLATRYSVPDSLPMARSCSGRRPGELRSERYGRVPPRGRLYWAHSHGRQAGGFARPAIHEDRAGDQPQDREGARPHRAAVTARPRRRGD